MYNGATFGVIGGMHTKSARAERAEYERVLASGIFPANSSSARLLQYVCGQYFEGKTTVSEYSIAVEVLGRRPDFDPKQDAIVRVEAHRVRKRLAKYYEGQRAGTHVLHLVLPFGSYLPAFVPAVPRTRPEDQGPGSARVTAGLGFVRRRLAVIGILALICLAVLAVALWKLPVKGHEQLPARNALSTGGEIPAAAEVRIMAGSQVSSYTDRLGHVWSADRYFTGGDTQEPGFRRISRTQDPQLFLRARQGRDFSYDIPLPPGVYELRLYFAETFYGEDNQEDGGESSRVFDVLLNGERILTSFDPISDAGGDTNTADVRVFKDVSPAADGKVHLRFQTRYTLKAVAIVNGIEIVPGRRGIMLPIRWVASDTPCSDSAGHLWQPDQFSHGGRRRTYREAVTGTASPELYHSERFGHFSYRVPVANGKYRLTLHFAEHWFGVPVVAGGPSWTGMRVFDVYCNGVALLRKFDTVAEAGGSLKAIQRTFRGLEPDAQGKLVLTFVPIRDYASVSAIEIVDENDRQ